MLRALKYWDKLHVLTLLYNDAQELHGIRLEDLESRPANAVPVTDSPRARASKRKLSSEAQKRMNAKYSYQKLELMLAANFLPGDLVVSLTYDDRHLAQAAARLQFL